MWWCKWWGESYLTGRQPMVKSLASSRNVSNKGSRSWNRLQNTKRNKTPVHDFPDKELLVSYWILQRNRVFPFLKYKYKYKILIPLLTSGPAWCSGWNWTEKNGRLGERFWNLFTFSELFVFRVDGWIYLVWTRPSFDLSFSLMSVDG